MSGVLRAPMHTSLSRPLGKESFDYVVLDVTDYSGTQLVMAFRHYDRINVRKQPRYTFKLPVHIQQ